MGGDLASDLPYHDDVSRQGVSAGVGVVIGRAMVRDVFDGTEAQKIMALVAMIFALAPALAPVCGGWLLLWTGWRSIFIFLAILSACLVVVSWFLVPETLPPACRHRLDPVPLARAYATLLTKPRFVALALANAAVNLGIYLYVLAAPTFVVRHLGLGEQSFGYLFVPIVLGLIAGAAVAHRVAGGGSPARSVILGHLIMIVAGVINIAVNAMHASPLPWDLVALPIFGLGMMLTQPSLQVMALDCFPERRGLAVQLLRNGSAVRQLSVVRVAGAATARQHTPHGLGHGGSAICWSADVLHRNARWEIGLSRSGAYVGRQRAKQKHGGRFHRSMQHPPGTARVRIALRSEAACGPFKLIIPVHVPLISLCR
jgi:MFS family permease